MTYMTLTRIHRFDLSKDKARLKVSKKSQTKMPTASILTSEYRSARRSLAVSPLANDRVVLKTASRTGLVVVDGRSGDNVVMTKTKSGLEGGMSLTLK